MNRKIISLAFFLFLWIICFHPVTSLAGNVIIFKGSSLSEDTLNGLLTIPYMQIQVASWGLAYSNDDLLIYEPSMRTVSLYEDSLLSTLPDPDETITFADGTTGSLIDVLETELFVIFETDIGIATLDVLDHFAATVPILQTGDGGGGGDSTPPNTNITSGPADTITDNDVLFTYTGSDNLTNISNLVYSYKLDNYESNWSAYSYANAKSYTDLPNGFYTFNVRAKDQSGNVDLTPAQHSFTVNYLDTDGDGVPDARDICPNDKDNDSDNDGICGDIDTFPDRPIFAGDINNDGSVDLIDAVAGLKFLAGIPPSITVFKQADINGDGEIGTQEIIYSLQIISGLKPSP